MKDFKLNAWRFFVFSGSWKVIPGPSCVYVICVKIGGTKRFRKLYVGNTQNLKMRLMAHATFKTIIKFSNPEDVIKIFYRDFGVRNRKIEKRMIHFFKPPYNFVDYANRGRKYKPNNFWKEVRLKIAN